MGRWWDLYILLFLNIFVIYLKITEKVGVTETERKSSMYWFTPQMVTLAEVRSLELLLVSHMDAGAKRLGHSLLHSQAH